MWHSFDVLEDGSLVLTLRDACIQTTARRAHRELTGAMLSGSPAHKGTDADLLFIVASFLVATDFNRLRAEHPELAGGTQCRVRLFREKGDSISWEVIKEETR